MHFQQFEDLKFQFFPGKHVPEPSQSVQLSQNRRDCPDSLSESRIPNRPQSGHDKYPDFEDQLAQAEKYIFAKLSNVCHKNV